MSPPSPHQEAPLPDLDAAYAEALAVASSGRRGSEAQLLRLMQRTGCCWGELQPGTAQGLMEAFTARLQVCGTTLDIGLRGNRRGCSYPAIFAEPIPPQRGQAAAPVCPSPRTHSLPPIHLSPRT